MSEYSAPSKTRQQPGIDAAPTAGIISLPPAALARRRRVVRLVGLVTVVIGLGLSAIPGPKTGKQTDITETENGVTTVTHKFSYHQAYGMPFAVARAEFDEAGEIRKFGADGQEILGLFGNLAVALAIAILGAVALGRRRREP